MPKRGREHYEAPPAKRICPVVVSRKRRREEDATLQEAERVVRARIEPPTNNLVHINENLRRENAYLRMMLGKVGRLGLSLKAQRDALLAQQTTQMESLAVIAVR